MSGWVTVFDVASEPFRWGNAGEGLAALALVALGAAVSIALRRRGARGATLVMSLACGVAAFFVARTFDHRREHLECVEASRGGGGRWVEGTVERFRPVVSVWQRPAWEEFEVGGERIRYPLIAQGCGFHRVLVEGGPIREGMQVRLLLWREQIRQLQIAGGDGPAPPAAAGSPGRPPRPGPPGRLPGGAGGCYEPGGCAPRTSPA